MQKGEELWGQSAYLQAIVAIFLVEDRKLGHHRAVPEASSCTITASSPCPCCPGGWALYYHRVTLPYLWSLQITADIFEPQGISTLDAEASFITNDLLGSALTKSFSGKKVV